MKKKIEIVSHGNTWIDPSTPIVCPECASLNIEEEDIYNSSEWCGPFKIIHNEKICSCKDCKCRFKISKDKMNIHDCCWDELFFDIFALTIILLGILLIISAIF